MGFRLTRARAAAVAFACSAALALTACGGGGGSANGSESGGSGDVTVGLTYIPTIQFAPAYVAEDDGLFEEQGLNATLRHHGADEGLFTALAAGEEDVVVATGDEVLQARGQGMDLVSIGAFFHHYPVVIIAPDESGIKTIPDLKGKKVGVPGEYGSSWFGLLFALQSQGMTTDDVDVVSIGFTAQSALAQGEVDAVMGFKNNDLVRITQGGQAVHSIPIIGHGEPPLIPVSIVTTHKWAKENPEQAKGVVEAITRVTQLIIDKPQTAIDSTKTRDDTLVDAEAEASARAVLEQTIPLLKGPGGKATGKQDLNLWERMGTFMEGVPGLLNEKPDVSQAVTNDYVTT